MLEEDGGLALLACALDGEDLALAKLGMAHAHAHLDGVDVGCGIGHRGAFDGGGHGLKAARGFRLGCLAAFEALLHLGRPTHTLHALESAGQLAGAGERRLAARHLDVLAVNLLDKAAHLLAGGVAILVARHGVGERELFLGTGHGHVEQAALLLKLLTGRDGHE